MDISSVSLAVGPNLEADHHEVVSLLVLLQELAVHQASPFQVGTEVGST